MSGIQNELGPKGLQVIEGAFNDNPDLPDFLRRFKPTFPVGTTDRDTAMGYMQLSSVVRSYVPYLMLIDRTGMIRAQYTGSDPLLADEFAMDKNLRAEIMKLLTENTKSAVKPAKHSAKR